jgi:DNA-binding Xre family transcriptional regulator
MELIHSGNRLKEIQNALNISSAELSRKTGISPQQMIRHRDQANMKLHTMQVICGGLGIKTESFITNEYN